MYGLYAGYPLYDALPLKPQGLTPSFFTSLSPLPFSFDKSCYLLIGDIAQLARAPALQAGCHRFNPVHLHHGLGFSITSRDFIRQLRQRYVVVMNRIESGTSFEVVH